MKDEMDDEILERIFVDSPVPIQIFDSRGEIRRQNDAQSAFDAAFGSLGAPRIAEPAERDARLHAEMLERALAGEVVDYELSLPDPGGAAEDLVWFDRVLSPVLSEQGAVRSVVSVTIDVTERKKMEDEKRRLGAQLLHAQKLESLGVLAGGIAHDFNNLLVAVLGNASLLRRELPEGSSLHEYAESIENAARRAADVAHQMLAYAGKGRFVTVPVELSRLIEETATLLRVSVSRRATLGYELDRALPIIRADPTQLRQVVMNLLTNASEALGDRPGRIVLRTGVTDTDAATMAGCVGGNEAPPGRYLFIEVEDDGCGMSAETQSRVFDPFFTTKFTGRGLGLAAVFGIVRAHRGAIRIRSEEGRGTTIRVLLPAPLHPERHSDTRAVSRAPEVELSGRGAVLVVDDEPSVRTVATSMIRALGLHALEAEDGLSALQVFEQHRDEIVAVLLDMTMPNLDGREARTRLRRAGAHVPIVLMSGFDLDLAETELDGGRPLSFLPKPFSLDELTDTLVSLLAGRTLNALTRE